MQIAVGIIMVVPIRGITVKTNLTTLSIKKLMKLLMDGELHFIQAKKSAENLNMQTIKNREVKNGRYRYKHFIK